MQREREIPPLRIADMAQPKRDKKKDYLFQAILTLETVDDCYNFFEDLCTIKEI